MTNPTRQTATTITDGCLTDLYDQLEQLAVRLRAVRLRCEQLARTADDIDPLRLGGENLDVGRRLDIAQANAIRRCTQAVISELAGHGHPPRVPEARTGHHDHSSGWDTR